MWVRTRALLSSGAALLTVKSDDKISQASAVFQYLTTITLSPGERAGFPTFYWGIPSHFLRNFYWHKARNHSGHVGMPLTCSYLYFNKPNRCTWICLSNPIDSTKNIKCFQSSHLIGIFKNIGIMPQIAWKCSPPVAFPQILMHLPWHRCIQKKTHKTSSTLRCLSLQFSLSRTLDTLLILNPYNISSFSQNRMIYWTQLS